MKCNFDCFNCTYKDCRNVGNKVVLTDEEIRFSDAVDSYINSSNRQEEIDHIDDPRKRATAKYRQTPKGKEQLHRWNTSDKAKECFSKYEKTEKAKARRKKHEEKPERKAYRKEYMKEYMKKYREEKKSENRKEK